MAGSDQCGFMQGRRQVRGCFVNRATPFVGQRIMTALLQAVSADGTRYIQRDVEFWIKGKAPL
jgi:hypothetical protein